MPPKKPVTALRALLAMVPVIVSLHYCYATYARQDKGQEGSGARGLQKPRRQVLRDRTNFEGAFQGCAEDDEADGREFPSLLPVVHQARPPPKHRLVLLEEAVVEKDAVPH